MVKSWVLSLGALFYLLFLLDVPLVNSQARRERPRQPSRISFHPIQTLHTRQPLRSFIFQTSSAASIYKSTRETTALMTTSITEQPLPQTTELRGDQRPDSTDDFEADDMPEFYPLGGHNALNSYNTFYGGDMSLSLTQRYKGAFRPIQRPHPCEHSSCYPATGNLLIGRENRLQTSSTCGLRRPERFCIVSHLEEKKCFLCDTRAETENDSLKNHRVGQIIYKNQPGTLEQSWWQSENGKENVTIQLDLEAEFHFTHLIIVFATFRPAAMLIERSYDFGKTWHVYRYFAHTCSEAFPNVPSAASSRNITDVVCDQRYSGVEPSKHGEVIYRVLPPNSNIINPYAEHVQNMLKMTNLRINFTRLHSLGDTLLDDREEIQEKYYYAISNMVVRGSCSCYGHASRCLPLDGVVNKYDMVHGRCECTHNTKGLNCEECEDFFNDLPWKPALGKQTNACKKCNCNNHATSCHFDHAVYEHSGRVSGGVCDNCAHNTQNRHCEECMPFFYRDPNEDIQSPHVCKPCDCDPRGSLDDGICDSVTDLENGIDAGACHCKSNVKGRRCDNCKEGFWNFDENTLEGCQQCTCNTMGTVNNSGCNVYTGECTCKRLVTGRDCNQCMPETYGLSEDRDGCNPCNCDAGGSMDNNCDVITGQCRCRPYMQGRACSEPKQNYFIPNLHNVYEAEHHFTICDSHSSYGNCSVVLKEPYHDREQTWTGPGFQRVYEGTDLEFNIDNIPKTMNYDVIIRYQTQMKGDWEDARITVARPEPYDPEGACANSHPAHETNRPIFLPEYDNQKLALQDVCLESGKVYKIRISFTRHNSYEPNPAAQILIDSLALIPRIEVTPIFAGSAPAENRLREYTRLGCNQTYYEVNYDSATISNDCKDILNTVSIYVFNGATPCECNPTGSLSKKCEEFGGHCQCKPNIVGRSCEKCAPGNYGFSPEGCKACDCNHIGAKDNDCDLITGQCTCHPNTYGRECDQCQPGFWNFPNCQMCQCNGHAQQCDSRTGECLSCQDYTTGYNCDSCIHGYYGDPLLGSEIGCRPCRCPDTIASGHSYASECALISSTNDVACYCEKGYSGARCDICSENFYGNPDKPGGICKECNCSNNVDPNSVGNCDKRSGKCLKCMYNTEGDHCEYCRDGYHGDALQQDCRQCDCNLLGTNSTVQFCDRYSGQCPCLKNVQGLRCEECSDNHWKIASGEGCEACDCDPVGSVSDQCNPYDGQCTCKKGFGGRACNQCETNFYGDPNVQCKACECNPYGSSSYQCDRENGQCVCNEGIGGHKCDQCARGYLGQAPYCSPCGECFDNWDLILTNLRERTRLVIDEAKQIKQLGTTGAYSKDFSNMAENIELINQLLANTTISDQDIKEIDEYLHSLRKHLNTSLTDLQTVDNKIDKVYNSAKLDDVALIDLRTKGELVKQNANDLKENATKLQEANIEGALNLTRDAWHRVNLLQEVNRDTLEMNKATEKQCKRTEAQVSRSSDEFDRLSKDNDDKLVQYQAKLDELSAQIPVMNEQVCDKRGDPCDSLCGGAGCGLCGGLSCEKGALSRADKALNYVKDTEKIIKEKEEKAEDLIRSMSQAKTNASEAYRKATRAYESAKEYHNTTLETVGNARELITYLTEAINNNTASPSEITALTEDTLKFELHLDPNEINNLAGKITTAVSHLENVDSIIASTRYDLERVQELKENAESVKQRAEAALGNAKEVVNALDEAETAQKEARKAIKQASDDIGLAKLDLGDIDSETDEAQKRANETTTTVSKLQNRLNVLQRNLLKNELDAKDIKTQAENVKESAGNAHELATQLKNTYRSANNSLTLKAQDSENARERAQRLLQRASKITVDTSQKLKELQGMADIYKSNDRELEELQTKLANLNDHVANHLSAIQKRADGYRQCTS